MSTARTKRRWARWSPEPLAASQDIPTTDPDFLRGPDAHRGEAVRDRTGWPWVTGTPAPSPAPETDQAIGDDRREDWVSPRRRQFWGSKAAAAVTEQNGAVAAAPAEQATPAAEMPAVTDEPERHTGIVEALSELHTRDLDKPKSRRFRRDKMAPRPADYEVAPTPVEEPAPQPAVAEAAAAPAVAEAHAAAAVAEVPVEPAEQPAAAAEPAATPRAPRRRWFARRAQVEAEEAAWEAERPKWPWITQTNGAAPSVSEAAVASEPEPVVAEEPPASVVAEEPVAPVVPEPAMPVLVAEPPAEQPVANEQAAPVEEVAAASTEAVQAVPGADEEETPRRRAMWRRQKPSAGAEDDGAVAMAPPDWKAEPEVESRSKDADAEAEDGETPRRRALWRRQAAMVPAEDASGAGMPPLLPERDDEEEPEHSRWGWLGTKRVAVVILLLLAAEVGYVVHLNTQSSSNKSTPPVTLAAPPSTTAPNVQAPAPTPTTVPAAAPAPAPTTAPKTAPAVAAAKAAPLAPCTTGDLSVVTTTSGNSVGAPVGITTTITAVHSCIFQPAAVQPGNCASWIVVDQAGGSQVFPSSTQVESCNPPAGQTMNPGSSESVSVSWIPPKGSAGTYQAVGIWGWASQSGSPSQISMPSQPFSVS